MIAAALEEDPQDWQLDAQLAIIRLSITEPEFSADDLRRVLRPAPHPNSVGAAFAACRNLGFIEVVNTTTSKAKTRNHGSLKTWRRKINEGVAAA